MPFTFQHLRDEEVDDNLDRQIRDLLLECFPHNAHLLAVQRHFQQVPENRWVALDENGILAAQIAVFEKILGAGDEELKVLGIADVAVSPQFRGQGLVKIILSQVHEWGKENGFEFGALGGKSGIYSSSGYLNATNSLKIRDINTGEYSIIPGDGFMYRPLGEKVWPDGIIDLRGPTF
jgi:predicted N-acetyltransferase YhbS